VAPNRPGPMVADRAARPRNMGTADRERRTGLSYAEFAEILEHLPVILKEARSARHCTLRDVAQQIGVSASTIMRMENGEGCQRTTAVAILRWLDQPAVQAGGTAEAEG
jgi:DNA-binding XRE family transcriptional regulator